MKKLLIFATIFVIFAGALAAKSPKVYVYDPKGEFAPENTRKPDRDGWKLEPDGDGYWSAPDIKRVSESIVAQCLAELDDEDSDLAKLVEKLGRRPRVGIGLIDVSGMSEFIKAENIRNQFKNALKKYRKVQFFESDINIDKSQERQSRRNEMTQEDAQSEIGQLEGEDLQLNISVSDEVTDKGKFQIRTYYVIVTLMDSAGSGLEIWSGNDDTVRRKVVN